MGNNKKKQYEEAQLAIENAIEAIRLVANFTEAPTNRYRETLIKLEDDKHLWQTWHLAHRGNR